MCVMCDSEGNREGELLIPEVNEELTFMITANLGAQFQVWGCAGAS
jgi:hypothetical protein